MPAIAARTPAAACSNSRSRSARSSALWLLTWLGLYFGYWISLLLVVPAAGFLVRLFMIQHDCGHGSFFRSKWLNDWIGRVLGVLTFTPYDFWRHTHAVHHASSGNLGRRGMGDIDTLTVAEYLALSWWGRLRYRLYRHPLVMFGLGPIYMFVLQHRLPVGLMRDGWRPWLSTMLTNLAIAVIAAVLIFFIGIKAFLLVHLPIMLLAAAAGVWLFYVQHQFEDTVWARGRHRGIGTRPRCTAPRIMTCPACCAGSRRTSACTTCTISRAAFRSIGCATCCAIIRSSARSGG